MKQRTHKGSCTDGGVPHRHTQIFLSEMKQRTHKGSCTDGGVPHRHTQIFLTEMKQRTHKGSCTDGVVPHRHTYTDISHRDETKDSPKRREQMAVSHTDLSSQDDTKDSPKRRVQMVVSHTHTRRHISGLTKAPCTDGGVPHRHTYTQTFFRTHQSAVYRWRCPTQTHIHADIFQDSPKRLVQMAVSHNSQACTSYPHLTRNLTHDCIQTRDCFRSGSSLVRMSRPQIPRCLAQSRCEARLGVLHGKTERLRHT